MSTVWNKIDSGLSSIYSNYLQVRKHGPASVVQVHPIVAAGGRLNITLQYRGELSAIKALGFKVVSDIVPGLALVAIDLADLEQLILHPTVLKMSFTRARRPMLDKSIPDIRVNSIWQVSNGSFSGSTGAGVIIGVIDTGVDIHHEFLRRPTPAKETRILRIWDQGLVPETIDRPPDPLLLGGGGATYGVEYDRARIMSGLAGLGNFRHRDCNGHGTHVASIAAGNGQDAFRFVGVAPEADLIIVKHLYLANHPQIAGADIDYGQLFRDAVAYILNVAKTVFDRPVVINASIGDSTGPHDGFTLDEDFLTARFKGAAGRCFVAAAGNEAGTSQHARIKFPVGGGTVVLPLFLFDQRTNKLEYNYCVEKNETRDLYVMIYYPDGATEISCALTLPLRAGGPVAGPAIGDTKDPVEFGFGRQCTMTHSVETDHLTFTGRQTVSRRKFEIRIEPHRHEHLADVVYGLEISSPDELTVHVWADQDGLYGFGIGESVHSNVFIDDIELIGDPGGADGILTVACYDAETTGLPLAGFSSRGPLVDYGGSPSQPDKPDIAAPGVDVDAARSRDAWPRRKKKHEVAQRMGGTSMSAPHVAGVAALMLEKDPTLTASEIASKLKQHARPVPSSTADEAIDREREFGAGRLDAKAAFDNV